MNSIDSITDSSILISDLESVTLSSTESESSSNLNLINDESTSYSNSIKSVSFSPLASFIPLPTSVDEMYDINEGKDEEEVRKGRPKLSVRSYSGIETDSYLHINHSSRLEPPSIKQSFTKMITSISNSLQPLLSPSSTSGNIGGVCSITSNKSYFDDSCTLTSFSSSKAEDEEKETSSGRKLSIKLPTLSRRLSNISPTSPSSPNFGERVRSSRSFSLDSKPLPRSCLKSPDRSSSSTIPLPSVSTISTTSTSSPPTLLSSSPTQISGIPLSPISSTTSTTFSSTSISTTSSSICPSAIKSPETIPLSPCCLSCSKATLYGKSEEWKESFSRGAKIKRRDEIPVRFRIGERDEVKRGEEGEDNICGKSKKVKEEVVEGEEGEEGEEGIEKWKKVVVDELPRIKSIEEVDESLPTTVTSSTLTGSTIASSPIPTTISSSNHSISTPPTSTPIESKLDPNLYISPSPPELHAIKKVAPSSVSTTKKPTRRRFSLSSIIDSSTGTSSSGGRSYA